MGVLTVSSALEFDKIISSSSGKGVFVDFFAEWCGPCKMIAPKLEELSQLHTGVVFLKVDVDSCQDLSQRFGIRAMPTFIAFEKGQEVGKVVGADLGKIKQLIERIDKPTAFSGEAMKLGGSGATVDENDAKAAREARARAAEARLKAAQ